MKYLLSCTCCTKRYLNLEISILFPDVPQLVISVVEALAPQKPQRMLCGALPTLSGI